TVWKPAGNLVLHRILVHTPNVSDDKRKLQGICQGIEGLPVESAQNYIILLEYVVGFICREEFYCWVTQHDQLLSMGAIDDGASISKVKPPFRLFPDQSHRLVDHRRIRKSSGTSKRLDLLGARSYAAGQPEN
ncbi:MAG: hypothetical protein MUC83_14290, partial [Pirellula sp.]|nr:hypothetical protein [Pirellula sp.]